VKCFLHCDYNRIGKKVLWKGDYHCLDKNCNVKVFKAEGVKKIDNIEVTITFKKSEPNHEKLTTPLRITREKRLDQQKSLAINGVSNCIHFNDLYNETVNNPSNLKKLSIILLIILRVLKVTFRIFASIFIFVF